MYLLSPMLLAVPPQVRDNPVYHVGDDPGGGYDNSTTGDLAKGFKDIQVLIDSPGELSAVAALADITEKGIRLHRTEKPATVGVRIEPAPGANWSVIGKESHEAKIHVGLLMAVE